MQCPNCGQENRAGAAFCLQCGTKLADASETTTGRARTAGPSVTSETAPTPPLSHEPGETELTHRGHAFAAGYGADFYGVWDLRVAGEPVARFERTPIGWEAAWRRFQELDRKYAVPRAAFERWVDHPPHPDWFYRFGILPRCDSCGSFAGCGTGSGTTRIRSHYRYQHPRGPDWISRVADVRIPEEIQAGSLDGLPRDAPWRVRHSCSRVADRPVGSLSL